MHNGRQYPTKLETFQMPVPNLIKILSRIREVLDVQVIKNLVQILLNGNRQVPESGYEEVNFVFVLIVYVLIRQFQ